MNDADKENDLAREHVAGRLPWMWMLLAAVVVCAAFAFLHQVLQLRGKQRQTTMIGGNDVAFSLAEVTHGKQLEFHEPWLLRWTKDTPLREWLGIPRYRTITQETKHEGVGVAMYRFGDPLKSAMHAEFSDGRGWKSITWGLAGRTIRENPRQWVTLYAVEPVPRKSPRLQLRLLTMGSADKPVAQFEFANPLYDPSAPVAGSAALPVSAADGDLSVTLHQLVTGVRNIANDKTTATLAQQEQKYRAGNFPEAPEAYSPCTVAHLSMEQDGTPSRDWAVARASFRDTAGNEYDNQYVVAGPHYARTNGLRLGQDYYYCLSPMMWTGEGPFKLKLDLARAQNYRADELLTVTAVVPEAGMLTSQTVTAVVGGTTVTFQGICGSHYTESNGREWTIVNPTAFLLLEDPRGVHARVATLATESTYPLKLYPGDTPNHIATSAGPTRRRERYSIYCPSLRGEDAPPAGTTITLTFAVTPTRTVEFEAEPAAVKPAP